MHGTSNFGKRPNFQNGQKAGKTGQNGQNFVIFSQASGTLNNQVILSHGNPQMRWTLFGGYLFKCKYQTFNQVSEKTSSKHILTKKLLQVPPRAIKHQLTCPFELTSDSFLIGRIGNLVIPRNRLEEVPELNSRPQDERVKWRPFRSLGPLIQGKPVGQTWYKTSAYHLFVLG